MNLYLDDIRFPKMSHNKTKGLGENYSDKKNWNIVRDYFEFVDAIQNKFDEIEIISFDHDLACYQDKKEYNGLDCVRYVIDYCIDNNKKFPSWYVHSDNVVGKKNMIDEIISYLSFIEKKDYKQQIRYYHNGILDNKLIS